MKVAEILEFRTRSCALPKFLISAVFAGYLCNMAVHKYKIVVGAGCCVSILRKSSASVRHGEIIKKLKFQWALRKEIAFFANYTYLCTPK